MDPNLHSLSAITTRFYILLIGLTSGIFTLQTSFDQYSILDLAVDKPISLDPADSSCSGEIVYNNVNGKESVLERINCTETCEKTHPVQYVVRDMSAGVVWRLGQTGCTSQPDLLRLFTTPSFTTLFPTPSITTLFTTPSFTTEKGGEVPSLTAMLNLTRLPPLPLYRRRRREDEAYQACSVAVNSEAKLNESEAYTLWIRPDKQFFRGTILSKSIRTPHTNFGFDLNMDNGILSVKTYDISNSYPSERISDITGISILMDTWTHIGLDIIRDGTIAVFVNGSLAGDPITLSQLSRKRRSLNTRATRTKRYANLGTGSATNPVFIGISGQPYFSGLNCKATTVRECQITGRGQFVHVDPFESIEDVESRAQYNIRENRSRCPYNQTQNEVIDLFLCHQSLPECSQNGAPVPPCKRLCQEFMQYCGQANLNCSVFPERDCADKSHHAAFSGTIKKLEVREGTLTEREMTYQYSGVLPQVSPKTECLCPSPSIQLVGNVSCRQSNNYLPHTNRINTNYHGPYVINDVLGTNYYSYTNWFSRLGLEKVSITIDLQESFVVQNVTWTSPSMYYLLNATSTTVQLRHPETRRWHTIGYGALNCSAVSPILSGTDKLTLTQPSCVSDSFNEIFTLEFLHLRSGVIAGKGLELHTYVQEFLFGDAIRLILQGHSSSRNKFFGLSNVGVGGWRRNNSACNCFFGGYNCDNQSRCQCPPGAGDPMETNHTCQPYFRNVNHSLPAVIPPYGPKSGGTDVYLLGGFLFTPRMDIKVTIGRHECHIVNRTQTKIHLVTPNVTGSLPLYTPLAIEVYFVNKPLRIVLDETFTFREDPIVNSIEPLRTFYRGGIAQTVIGEYLDSVFEPTMNVTMVFNYNGNSYIYPQQEEICTVLNRSRMACPAPTINTTDLPPELKSMFGEATPSRKKRDAEIEFGLINSEFVQFYVGLKFDGVTKYSNVSNVLPTQGIIKVFKNPEIYRWDHNGGDIVRTFYTYKGESFIKIEGKEMMFGCTKTDYTVRIGDATCTVQDLYSNQLLCVPPDRRPPPGVIHIDGAPLVKLKVGNIEELVGYLRYEESIWDNNAARAGIIAAIVIIILIIIAIIVFIIMKKKREKMMAEREAEPNKYVTTKSLWEQLPADMKSELEPCMKQSESLKLGKKVGEGNFGTVFIGRFDEDKSPTILVAAKTVKDTGLSVKSLVEFLSEATLMKDFKHKNVLNLVGVVLQDDKPYVLLPLMEHGDLRKYLLNPNNKFTLADLLDFGLQVARGMQYLSACKFVHRDLAARNCMVGNENVVKVADFGLARDIYSNEYYRVENKSRPLPIKWMAPETLDDQKFTSKSDVWSFGVVMWELLTRGKKPYSDIDNFDLKSFIKRGNRLEKPQVAPDEVYEFMLQCWHMNPSSRPNFSNAVQELENILKNDEDIDEKSYSPIPDSTPGRSEYDKLSRYVDYSTDRHGYEDLHETAGYLDMSNQVDYVEAAKELGVDLSGQTADGYLGMDAASVKKSRDNKYEEKPKPKPKPRVTNPKAEAPKYQNLNVIQDQLLVDNKGKFKPSVSPKPKRVDKPGDVNHEHIALTIVAPPPAADDNTPNYQNMGYVQEN